MKNSKTSKNEVLASVIKHEKRMKRHREWKREIKWSLFVDGMTVCIENPENSTEQELL